MRSAASNALTIFLGLGLSLTLVGCGDDSTDGASPREGAAENGRTGSAADRTEPATGVSDSDRDRVSQPVRPAPLELPDAPSLSDDAARAELTRALADLAPEEASRATLLYLAQLGDRSISDVVRGELLARDEDGFDDPGAAALGLEILLVLGELDAVAQTLDLAQLLVDEEEEGENIVWALQRIEGARAAEADTLLVALVESDYDDVTAAAIEALAIRGSRAADSVLPGIVVDTEHYDAVRGSAIAAMLMTGHERAKTSADALLASDVDGSEVIAGFGIAGATGTVPYMQRIMKTALEDGNADLEFAEACYALAAVYRGTSSASQGRDLILGWLGQDPDLDCDEATYALWVLGDETRTDAAARLLASEVIAAARHDAELAVDLLEEVARRGLARDPRFAPAVDAAAITPDRTGTPGSELNGQRLRAAAAFAYLRSR